ncbi:hypothetical protein J3Q64DRAFT_1385228 [Phycomyces blakesleeanus]|uniref:MARVEL domain-containing protein n=2 Tax=Phycomyces blakesleeanus TaxID=4837 RepID=A0A162ZEU4_PHYB8|nr:hypothetical protein PHYBLDRAFT_152608 [Phycomyces blakesleeanus NRRL 1555(-)]OAD66281.1 hypothetical protein PHYBLDRAFT_152608 [Phycomyces blakesleeanus NRRL 1555(-)]|eukprot:XP_018284321.1 hypothetical protein PHYBLDRAFT_152608 [Phycomyces blakesleeanus NRRL 1555(-)]
MGRSLVLELPINVPNNMPHIGTVKTWLHILQAICTILSVSVVAPIIAIEKKYYGSSQTGPNYTLFAIIISTVTPIFLIYFPWMYDRKAKFKKLGKFCLKPRTSIVFSSFYSTIWMFAGIGMSVHATNANNCSIDTDLEETYGDTYNRDWTSQCNCAKAAAAFAWTICLLWFSSLICSGIILWNEKQWVRKNFQEHKSNKQNALQTHESKHEETLSVDDYGSKLENGSPPFQHAQLTGSNQVSPYATPVNQTPNTYQNYHHQQVDPAITPYTSPVYQQQQQQQQQSVRFNSPMPLLGNSAEAPMTHAYYQSPEYVNPQPHSSTPMTMPQPTQYNQQSF